jgi:hypothetical protein
MISNWCRALSPVAALLAATLAAQAQQQPPQAPPPQASPPQAQANPFCGRLEAQLQAFDRSGNDAGRADQLRKFEDAAAKQQGEIDRQEMSAQRAGCEKNSFFVLFSSNQATCGPLTKKIQQMRDNLDHIQADIERLRGGDAAPEREGQRRAIVVALAQNNCGQQYQQQVAATPPQRSGGLFETLFGPKSGFTPGEGGSPDLPNAIGPTGTFRTVCVRTCDGFYYPISAAATPARFAEDEKACRQSCPAAEVQLYSHRNPGETMNEAVSVATQQPYTALPNAFRYRIALDPACTCKRPGETWSQALKNIDDNTVEQGDIVVNDQRARQLSQPRVDAQGKPIKLAPVPAAARPDPKAAQATTPPAPAPAAALSESEKAADEAPSKPDPNRKVRSVGPTFLPGR